jgi:hypothetical protein
MDDAGSTALGHLSYTQHRSTIIVQLDNIALLYTSSFSIVRMYSGYPITVTILFDTMARDIL